MATEPSLPCKAQASKRCLKNTKIAKVSHTGESALEMNSGLHTHTQTHTLALAELSVTDHTLVLRTKILRAAWARLIFLSKIKKGN